MPTQDSGTAQLDIEINIGTSWSQSFAWVDSAGTAVDCTGWTGTCKIRKTRNLAEPAYTATVGALDSTGVITVTLAKSITETVAPGAYRWQIDVTDGTDTVRVVEGKATFVATVI